jgi:glycosyltransferase involved in cell wall biosynthesis
VLGHDGTWPEPLPRGSFHLGVGGVLVNRNDPEGLAAAMLELMRTPALRDLLARQARCRAVSHYSEDACVGEFLANVRLLLDRRRSAG